MCLDQLNNFIHLHSFINSIYNNPNTLQNLLENSNITLNDINSDLYKIYEVTVGCFGMIGKVLDAKYRILSKTPEPEREAAIRLFHLFGMQERIKTLHESLIELKKDGDNNALN